MESNLTFKDFLKSHPIYISIKNLFKSHPTFVISILYFIASILGLLYEVFLLSEFDIYAFHYIRIYEFFLSAFKTYEITGFSIICMIMILYTHYYHTKIKSEKKVIRFLFKLIIIVFVCLMISFPYIFAKFRAEYLKSENSKIVKVVLKTNNYEYNQYFFNKKTTMISTSENFIYLYHHNSHKSLIIPIGDILLIDYLD